MYFQHLQDVKQSYICHFYNASLLGIKLFYYSIRVFIHALYPDVFTDTTIQLKKYFLA